MLQLKPVWASFSNLWGNRLKLLVNGKSFPTFVLLKVSALFPGSWYKVDTLFLINISLTILINFLCASWIFAFHVLLFQVLVFHLCDLLESQAIFGLYWLYIGRALLWANQIPRLMFLVLVKYKEDSWILVLNKENCSFYLNHSSNGSEVSIYNEVFCIYVCLQNT